MDMIQLQAQDMAQFMQYNRNKSSYHKISQIRKPQTLGF